MISTEQPTGLHPDDIYGRPPANDPWDKVRLGWPFGAFSLKLLLNGEGQLNDNPPLPPRLLEGDFTDRPWPGHPLTERFIDLDYMAWTPPARIPLAEVQMVDIVNNKQVRINERAHSIGSIGVAAINVHLMAGQSLSIKEMQSLGVPVTGKYMTELASRLTERIGVNVFQESARPDGGILHYRLNEQLRFRDMRKRNFPPNAAVRSIEKRFGQYCDGLGQQAGVVQAVDEGRATAEQLASEYELDVLWRNVPKGWSLGMVSLRSMLDKKGKLDGRGPLPARLLKSSFIDRPWPDHSLTERFIDLDYIEWMDVKRPDETDLIDIIGDTAMVVNGCEYDVGPSPLGVINVHLLAGHWSLSTYEMTLLGAGSRNDIKQCRRILGEVIDVDLFEETNRNNALYLRLSDTIRFRDLRD